MGDGKGRSQDESNAPSLDGNLGESLGKMVPGDDIDGVFTVFNHTERLRQMRESLGDLGIYVYVYLSTNSYIDNY